MNSRIRILILVAGLLALGVAVYALPVGRWLEAVIGWIGAHRETAGLAFFATYVVATVFLIPGSILTVAAGFLFGVVVGTVVVSISSVAGATAAFLVGRGLGRDWVRRKVGTDRRLAAVDRATEDRGFLIVMLLRLSPVFPFNALNYFLSLTGVKTVHYVLASWIGMLPATILYVYIGSAAQDLAALLAGDFGTGAAGDILFFAGLGATALVTVLVTRFATRALRTELARAEEAQS
ncbi:TVP38/TMEM64 family protein [Lentisalinibacter salinarum]|uniref:TVP38/TMEM64 family protein n=1 Tax=Lentisalinibacter salinarum TaxID=2992239 RepID=UPI00386D5F58